MFTIRKLLTLSGIPTKRVSRRPSPEQVQWALEVFNNSSSSEGIPRKRGRSLYSNLSLDDRRKLQLRMQKIAGNLSPDDVKNSRIQDVFVG